MVEVLQSIFVSLTYPMSKFAHLAGAVEYTDCISAEE